MIFPGKQKKNIPITKVVVDVSGEFAEEGKPGYNIVYKAKLEGDAPAEALTALIKHTDKVAEIQNTLRAG